MDESSLPVTMQLAQAASDAQVRERARLSRALHDSIGGSLSAVAIELDLVRMDFAASQEIKARLEAIEQALATAFDCVRDLTYEVVPDLVERIGLDAALRRLSARTGARIQLGDGDSALTVPQATACYQIAELALDEALRRGANNLSLTLSRGQMEIRHDTTPASPDEPGWLLASVRMKLAALTAGLDISTVQDSSAGCTITQISTMMKAPGHAL